MKELNKDNFASTIKEGNSAVDFWAEWCGPCKMMAPVFEELSKEMKDVKFGKVNVDDNADIAGESAIRGIPTTILFKDGKEIDRIVGFVAKEALKEKLQKAFS